VRAVLAITAALVAALGLAACGSESISLDDGDTVNERGAQLFLDRCSGCHTLAAAGSVGSANRAMRNQGPNLDERVETEEDVLYAIRNGGFSGALMPQNIVTGEDAQAVAQFVADYAGDDVDRPPQPGQ
jgi:mono/diheme cytochrome c family protein